MKSLSEATTYQQLYWDKKNLYNNIRELVDKFEARIKGKRGAPEKREKFYANVERILGNLYQRPYSPLPREARRRNWEKKMALELADNAGIYFDEHGGWNSRGDYLSTAFVGYADAKTANETPYFDKGGEGLAVVRVTRTRHYARSSHWRPSSVTTAYLVGKNEAGTYFAHAVPERCPSVLDALKWIWQGHQDDIITRQGDIALIKSTRRNLPKLPSGHRIEGDMIVHDTHPPIRVPGKGESIIIARRAAVRASEETRD